MFLFCPGLLESSVEVVQPFLLGCDTKNPKIVQLCLGTAQRLISQQLLNAVCKRLFLYDNIDQHNACIVKFVMVF